MKKIAFVIPWFYKDIPGGAEMEMKMLAKHLHEDGVDVEILTTCVKEFSADWYENYFEPGEDEYEGMKIRRFPVRVGDAVTFHKINAKFMRGRKVNRREEYEFLREMVNSDALENYIGEHRDEYDKFIFIPYMFGTTYHGLQRCAEKAVLIPCLHDESYAYMESFKEKFATVHGMIFHAHPEEELAERLYDLSHVKHAVLGEGIDTDVTGDGTRFREKFGVKDPYILYAGRKDSAKNIPTLLKYFEEFKKRNTDGALKNLKLIMIGGGELEIPEEIKGDVLDLGYVDRQDKYDACAGAILLTQPSKNESFSLVIMESWLCGRPVLVSADCNVTSDFARRTNGGLEFKDYFEFEQAVLFLGTHEEEARIMGENGGRYVRENFSWDVIVKKYRDFLEV